MMRYHKEKYEKKNEESGSTIYIAIEYINQHYTDALSLNEAINVAAMSRTAFVNQFKQVTGKSFVEYEPAHLTNMRNLVFILLKQLFCQFNTKKMHYEGQSLLMWLRYGGKLIQINHQTGEF